MSQRSNLVSVLPGQKFDSQRLTGIKAVKELVHVVRSPTWVVPSFLSTLKMGRAAETLDEIEVDDKLNFSTAQVEKFKADPVYYRKFVKTVEREVNNNFRIVSCP